MDNIDNESNINAGFSSTLTANPDSGKTIYDKLDLVSSYLEKEGAVGTVDSPKQYFKGMLPMRGVLMVEMKRPNLFILVALLMLEQY